MLSLLWPLILFGYTLAFPTAKHPSVIDTPTALSTADEDAVFNTKYRSTIQIVWSSLTIIFASSWLCVHPNIAGYHTTQWQRIQERLQLFALAVFAPELLALFAFHQWKGCRELHKKFKERANGLKIPLKLGQPPELPVSKGSGANVGFFKRALATLLSAWEAFWRVCQSVWPSSGLDPEETAWTYTHAHFVQMGGIVFKNATEMGFKEPSRWDDEDLTNFFKLRLPAEAISDKGKASALAKALVIGQVLWFVIQTIARGLQGLPITQLEVVCLAFTSFNIGMYYCWWDKPLDVAYPLEVPGYPHRSGIGFRRPRVLFGFAFGLLDALPVGAWVYSPKARLHPQLYSYRREPEFENGQTDARTRLSKLVDSVFSGHPGGLGGAFTIALSFTSFAFGALHVIGWSLPTPSHTERVLWRASCLVLVSYPGLLLVIPLLGWPLKEMHYRNLNPKRSVYFRRSIKLFIDCLTLFVLLISFLGMISYLAARLILIVLPFLELRDLPLLAHRTVSWSDFIPHV